MTDCNFPAVMWDKDTRLRKCCRQSQLCFKDGHPIVGESAAQDENLAVTQDVTAAATQGRGKHQQILFE